MSVSEILVIGTICTLIAVLLAVGISHFVPTPLHMRWQRHAFWILVAELAWAWPVTMALEGRGLYLVYAALFLCPFALVVFPVGAITEHWVRDSVGNLRRPYACLLVATLILAISNLISVSVMPEGHGRGMVILYFPFFLIGLTTQLTAARLIYRYLFHPTQMTKAQSSQSRSNSNSTIVQVARDPVRMSGILAIIIGVGCLIYLLSYYHRIGRYFHYVLPVIGITASLAGLLRFTQRAESDEE